MIMIMVPLIPPLIIILTALFYGTGVRITRDKLYIGFRAYDKEQISRYLFRIYKDHYRPPRHSFRMQWRVVTEVYRNHQHLRTHYINVRNQKSAEKVISAIKSYLTECKK